MANLENIWKDKNATTATKEIREFKALMFPVVMHDPYASREPSCTGKGNESTYFKHDVGGGCCECYGRSGEQTSPYFNESGRSSE